MEQFKIAKSGYMLICVTQHNTSCRCTMFDTFEAAHEAMRIDFHEAESDCALFCQDVNVLDEDDDCIKIRMSSDDSRMEEAEVLWKIVEVTTILQDTEVQ